MAASDSNSFLTMDKASASVENASSLSRSLWITFVTLLTYLAVTAGTVTHRDLLLESPLTLPLLDVSMPLVAFFWVTPLILLIFHVYLMLNIALLADTIRLWEDTVRHETRRLGALQSGRQLDGLRRQLPNFIAVQILAGPLGVGSGVRFLLKATFLITVAFAPVLVLLEMLMQFLPYHSANVAGLHRVVIAVDLLLLWFFWPSITGTDSGVLRRIGRGSGACAIIAIMIFSNLLATFPGEEHHEGFVSEWLDAIPIALMNDENDVPCESLSECLFGQRLTYGRFREGIFANSILISVNELTTRSETEIASMTITNSFVNRDLSQANFSGSDLRKSDFSGAKLDGASFSLSRLDGARFDCSFSGDARCTNLEGALFHETSLVRASFTSATLVDAGFVRADLLEADLSQAHATQASFFEVDGRGTKFVSAILTAATIYNHSSFQGADFSMANMDGLKIETSSIDGASFDFTSMDGSSIIDSTAGGAWFNKTSMRGSLVDSTFLGGSVFQDTETTGSSWNAVGIWRQKGLARDGTVSIQNDKTEPQLEGYVASRIYDVEPDKVVPMDGGRYQQYVKYSLRPELSLQLANLVRGRLRVLAPDNEFSSGRAADDPIAFSAQDHQNAIISGYCDRPYAAEATFENVIRASKFFKPLREAILNKILDGSCLEEFEGKDTVIELLRDPSNADLAAGH